jgi:hypothetical protein
LLQTSLQHRALAQEAGQVFRADFEPAAANLHDHPRGATLEACHQGQAHEAFHTGKSHFHAFPACQHGEDRGQPAVDKVAVLDGLGHLIQHGRRGQVHPFQSRKYGVVFLARQLAEDRVGDDWLVIVAGNF